MSSWAGLHTASCPKSQPTETTALHLEFSECVYEIEKVFSTDTSGSRKMSYFYLGKVTCNNILHFIKNTALGRGSPEKKSQTKQSSLN